MPSSNNKLAKIALIAIPCAFAITTCSLTGCFGGDKSKGNSTPSPQAPAVTHSDTNGPNRVSTTGLVGNEVIGYLTVPVSWREFSSGLYAEQHSAFTSKISGAQLYERAVEVSVANMTYAEAAQSYLSSYKSNTDMFRNVTSTVGQFKGNAATIIEGRFDDKMYFKTAVFDDGTSSGACRVITAYYLRDYEEEVLGVMDSWTPTP